MKLKALLTAAVLGTALFAAAPASADPPGHRGPGEYSRDYGRDYGRDHGDYGRDYRGGPRRWRPSLTLVTHRGAVSLQRDDRLFHVLTDAPYYFRPGFTYEYTDRCNRRGCIVNVYRGHQWRPIDRIFAPHAPMVRADFHGWRRDDWRNDGWRGDGERYERHRSDDLRDRDGYGLDGGPRRRS
jgi:hypothetical protein